MLEDCVALPMYVTKNTPIENADKDLKIVNKDKNVEIVITSDGVVSIKGDEINIGNLADEQAVLGNKLITYLEQITDTIKNHTHTVVQGTANISASLTTLSKPDDVLSEVLKIK